MNQFGGELIRIKLEYEGTDLNILYDFDGDNIRIHDKGNGVLHAILEIQDSEGLISWLMQCGQKFKVIEPVDVREKLIGRLKDALLNYE